MTHRPTPSRERARRQVDRHYGDVEPWAVARPRDKQPADEVEAEALGAGEYVISTR